MGKRIHATNECGRKERLFRVEPTVILSIYLSNLRKAQSKAQCGRVRRTAHCHSRTMRCLQTIAIYRNIIRF